MSDVILTCAAARAQPGDVLPPLDIALTTGLIVATALASRDFQPVHHDPEVARARGSPDIFMNILTTQGLVCRFVTDWAGPTVQVRRNAIRLGAPNHPGDSMVLTGSIAARRSGDGGDELDIAVVGRNGLGDHVTGLVTLFVPAGEIVR